jgi:hypothetical protein
MSSAPDPFEFVRNLWGQMGIPGFGAPGSPGMPSFAPEELEKRLGELKQIRQWLEINLNMLNLQVNGLEMQLNALKSMKSSPGAEFAAQAADAMRGAAAGQGPFANPWAAPAQPAPAQGFTNPWAAAAPPPPPPEAARGFAPAGFGQFPFGMGGAPQAAPAAAPAPPPAPAAPAAAAEEPAKPVAWPDPTEWMQTLQSEFVKNMNAIAPAAGKPGAPKASPKKAAAKKVAAKKPAARGAAKKPARTPTRKAP